MSITRISEYIVNNFYQWSLCFYPLSTLLIISLFLEACRRTWDDNRPRAKDPLPKDTNGGLAICLSACNDNQMAADTTVRVLDISI